GRAGIDGRRPRHPQTVRRRPPGEDVSCSHERMLWIGCVHRADSLVRLTGCVLLEHLPATHRLASPAACLAAKASSASRTHRPSSCAFCLAARRPTLHCPLPLTTAQNSSQSIAPCRQSPFASWYMSGSGIVRPAACSSGTCSLMTSCRTWSLVFVLMPHATSCGVLGESASWGPSII